MMKRTLRESLVDYDMALLRAVAEMRGGVLTSNHRPTAAGELEAQLVSPASLAIALADLLPEETEALAALQAAGGWIEAPRFARRFGAVRGMGPGRLEREQPWQSPANPAEGLWYRALIFKGFRQTEGGVVEVVYIPPDLLASLPDLSDVLAAHGDMQRLALEPVAPPARIHPASADAVEDVFGVLVTVRNRAVRPRPDGSLSPKVLQTINVLCVSPLAAADVAAAKLAADDRLALIVHLPRAAGLVAVDEGRLGLNSDAARDWLAASPAQRLLALQSTWRDDADWNDLWRVPSLKPQPTGWKNDPVVTRRQVLGFLAHCQPGEWYGLDDLTQAVKATNPDFQRPDGDYTAWYIHDLGGQALMGFEHWDEVEGALLRYLIGGPLHWLGVLDLGFEESTGQPTAFRLAESGLCLLELAAPPDAPDSQADAPDRQSGVPDLIVGDDFSVSVRTEASLYTRFQLARFADFLGREADHVRYRMSPQSLARARRGDISPDQISAFLARASGGRAPAVVLDGLRRWGERSGRVRLEPGVVLRVDRPETLKALRRDPVVGRLLGEALGPQAVLVPRANVRLVRRWLVEQGYLEQ